MSARMLMLSVFIPIGIIALVVAIWGTAIITSATGLVVLVAMTFVREFGWTGVATATLLLWLLKWVLK